MTPGAAEAACLTPGGHDGIRLCTPGMSLGHSAAPVGGSGASVLRAAPSGV